MTDVAGPSSQARTPLNSGYDGFPIISESGDSPEHPASPDVNLKFTSPVIPEEGEQVSIRWSTHAPAQGDHGEFNPKVVGRASTFAGNTYSSPIRHSTFGTEHSASFEETAVWDQKTILSLDGGGIRGYSALLILQALMKTIGELERTYDKGPTEVEKPAASSYHPLSPATRTITDPDEPNGHGSTKAIESETSPWLPCHYFDYVAGTSTGGFIGIMIGRLRMNIDDCISEYENLGGKVFGHSRHFHLRSPLFWPRDKYNFKILEDVVRSVVKRRVPKVDTYPGGRNFAFDENRCRTVVVAYQEQSITGVEKVYLFRTYKNLRKSTTAKERQLDRNQDLAHDIPIWQVARATSAAPTYFKPIVIDGREYLDSGFGANNPCKEIYEEVRRMNNNSERCVATILSIGTGKNSEARRFKGSGLSRYRNYLNFARKWATDSEQTHLAMLSTKEASGDRFEYFRLNVEEGLGQMKLDAWQARGRFRTSLGRWIAKLRSPGANEGTENPQAGLVRQQHSQNQVRNDARSQNGTAVEGEARHEQGESYGDGEQMAAGSGIEMDELGPASQVNITAEDSLNKASGHQSGTAHWNKSPAKAQPRGALQRSLSRIDEWCRPRNKTLEVIREHTQKYLAQDDVKADIKSCAALLVKSRRLRAKKNPQRWEKACFGTWYQCNVAQCPRGEWEYHGRKLMRRHLLDKHKDLFPPKGSLNVDGKLDSCKIIVH